MARRDYKSEMRDKQKNIDYNISNPRIEGKEINEEVFKSNNIQKLKQNNNPHMYRQYYNNNNEFYMQHPGTIYHQYNPISNNHNIPSCPPPQPPPYNYRNEPQGNYYGNYHQTNDINISSNTNRMSRMGERECSNCHTRTTPCWRKSPNKKDILCNACGLYIKLHGEFRTTRKISKPRKCQFKDEGFVKTACIACNKLISFYKYGNNRAVCDKCNSYYGVDVYNTIQKTSQYTNQDNNYQQAEYFNYPPEMHQMPNINQNNSSIDDQYAGKNNAYGKFYYQ